MLFLATNQSSTEKAVPSFMTVKQYDICTKFHDSSKLSLQLWGKSVRLCLLELQGRHLTVHVTSSGVFT